MNFILEFTKDQFAQENLPVSDVVISGLEVVGTGMITIFAVLTLLWFTLVVFKFFFHDLPKRRKMPKETVTESLPSNHANESVNNEEIIAVIAAAIAMAENECGSNKQFRVVSFKRK